MQKNNVMVFVEQYKGNIQTVSIELICEAHRLAKKLNVDVEAVILGHDLNKKSLLQLGEYGLKRIFTVEDKRLTHFTSVPYAKTVVGLIRKYEPQIVLYGASTAGRDMAPRVASELKCGLTADCTILKIGDYQIKDKRYENTLLQIRPAFGGNIMATIVSPESKPSMATVREGVMQIETLASAYQVEIISEQHQLSEDDFLTTLIEMIEKEKSVDLKNAKIIVAAGMGACTPSTLNMLKELAHTLGGEIGASRPVVDSGLLGKDHQIGQTGLTVRPNLYIACGVSGQIQHCAGMTESKRIMAINSDPNAPIFKVAHYGIVGDVNEVVPKLIKAYKNKSANQEREASL
jgi:electron transfer flavoprotein alpha subunit